MNYREERKELAKLIIKAFKDNIKFFKEEYDIPEDRILKEKIASVQIDQAMWAYDVLVEDEK